MKVLFITSAYPTHPDDARGIFIHRLARELCHQGIQVTVIAPGAPYASKKEEIDAVNVHRVKYWIQRWQYLATDLSGIVPNLKQRPWLLCQIPPLIAALTWRAVQLAISFDVIHAHWIYPAGIAGVVAAKTRKIPFVVTSHGGDLNLARHSRGLSFMSSRVSLASDECVGVSRDLCEQFVSFGVSRERVTLIPYGVDNVGAAPIQTSQHKRELERFKTFDGFRILYIGSLNYRKSVETLIEAYGILERRGYPLMCAIVGSGPSKDNLGKTVREHSYENICFVDPVPPSAVAGWMEAAHNLVLPSRSEGRPVVVLEAMAMGLPVVASDIPGTRELVRDRETGLLFRPGDSEHLASCIEQLIKDARLRQQMGQRAQEYIESDGLKTAEIARRYIALYERVIGSLKRASKIQENA
jgi:glycosyltransferase involved in cell wall biosynthesis